MVVGILQFLLQFILEKLGKVLGLFPIGFKGVWSDEVLGFLKIKEDAGFVNGGGRKRREESRQKKRVEKEGPPLVSWTMFYRIQ